MLARDTYGARFVCVRGWVRRHVGECGSSDATKLPQYFDGSLPLNTVYLEW